jgi:hypothetical protein
VEDVLVVWIRNPALARPDGSRRDHHRSYEEAIRLYDAIAHIPAGLYVRNFAVRATGGVVFFAKNDRRAFIALVVRLLPEALAPRATMRRGRVVSIKIFGMAGRTQRVTGNPADAIWEPSVEIDHVSVMLRVREAVSRSGIHA